MPGPHYESGVYLGRILQQAMSQAGTGNSQFILRFLVLGKFNPADPDSLVECQQYERTAYRTITEKTIKYFLQDLEVLGFDKDSFKFLDPGTNGFVDFAGKEVQFYCSHEPRQDGAGLKEQWSVARQGGSSTFEVKPIEPKHLRDLDNLFGKQLRGLKKTVPMTSAKQPVSAASGVDGDVPF